MVPVPDDPYYVAAFMGALIELGTSKNWARDTGHSASQVAQVWREIFNNLERCNLDDWTIRIKPSDCTIIQQFDPSTSTWRDAVDLTCAVDFIVNRDFPPIPTNPPIPGAGSPTPGQCFDINMRIDAKQLNLIPLPIASGWTLTTSLWSGAWSNSNGLAALWYCPDGHPFVLGVCGGSFATDATNPIPAAPRMCLIIAYPDGTYHQLTQGSALVIPAGQPAGNYYILCNDSDLTNNQSEAHLHLNACNTAWCYKMDFTVSNFSSFVTPHASRAVWVSGQGYTFNPSAPISNPRTLVQLDSVTLGSTNYTSVEFAVSAALGGRALFQWQVTGKPDRSQSNNTLTDFTITATDTGTSFFVGIDTLPADAPYLRSLTFRGTGTNPFGASNC